MQTAMPLLQQGYCLRPRDMRRQRNRKAAPRASGRRARETADRAMARAVERGLNADASGSTLARAVAAARAGLDRGGVDALRRILHRLASARSALLGNSRAVFALGRLIEFRHDWVRPINGWLAAETAAPATPRDQAAARLSGLARHLLCLYPVPPLFDQAWFSDDDGLNMAGRRWFVHLGGGANLRTAPGLPYPLNKRMAHHVLRAAPAFSLAQALRWGQFVGTGVAEPLARAATESRLVDPLTDDVLCAAFAQFLARHPDVAPDRVGPIVDYVLARRQGAPGLDCVPDFTPAGRTAASIEREAAAWHARIGRRDARRHLRPAVDRWEPSGIAGFDRTVAPAADPAALAARRWTAVELTNWDALFSEGQAMGHCVATYADGAATGRWALFSLRYDDGAGPQRRLTVEITLPYQVIQQARGRANRPATPEERRVLAAWAAEAGLLYSEGAVL